MNKTFFYPIILILLSTLTLVIAGGDKMKKLTSEDRKQVELTITRLRELALTDSEKTLVEDIELRCELFFFLRGFGFAGGRKLSANALKNLEDRKAAPIISIVLKHENYSIVTRAAEALGRIGDTAVVPNLIETLRKNNFAREGGEMALVHEGLKRQLVAALGKITKQSFIVSDINDAAQIEKVITTVEEWWRKHIQDKKKE